MSSRVVTLVLMLAFLAGCALWVPSASRYRFPGDHEGYEPVQPIAYSHRLHAGELQIACTYCHWAADRSRHAGIPAASVCMNCHRAVTSTVAARKLEKETADREKRQPKIIESPELRKLYDHLALDANLVRDDARKPKPIAWKRVYATADFVYFDHRAHVGAGVRCQNCHGPVDTMERVRQVGTLSMGWCVSCHREVTEHGLNGRQVKADTECSTCHR